MDFNNKIIYQIYPKSFKDTNGDGIGDLNGIIEKLDYIKDLGTDYIWLSPIMKSPQNDNGYDISDYYTIDPMFGNNEDYLRLIKEAKKRDLKVMMDLVLNHTSTSHEWFKRAVSGDMKYQEYYIFRDEPTELESVFGGDAWKYLPELDKYYLHMFDETQADLNWDCEALRNEIYEMINYWINQGVEGFRLDVIDMIGKNVETGEISRTPRFYELLEELNIKTFADKLLTVGECWGASFEQAQKMCNPKGLTQLFHFHDTTITNDEVKWDQKPLDLDALSALLARWNNSYDGINAWVLGNHDSPRRLSLWLNDDKYRKESAKLLITLYGFLRGNLYIYQGDEIGMTNAHMHDIKNYNDVETYNYYNEMKLKGISDKTTMDKIAVVSRDNARIPMQWNDTDYAGFSNVEPWLKMYEGYKDINVEKDLEADDSVYRYYQEIIKFRKEHSDIISETITFKTNGDILYFRKDNYVGILNFSDKISDIQPLGDVVFSNYHNVTHELRPYECIVFKI
ncbi:MAG: alpha-glucosidase [Erysipelotrichales bacterium]|nr:alpha-glucosidase [Erysipelotrichales bacterium]